MDEVTPTRRDVLKFTVAASAALAVPLAGSLRAQQASELPANRLPRPYAAEFTQPPVLRSTVV